MIDARLRRTLTAYTINRLGTWVAYIALAVAVYDHTHDALATASLFIAAQFVPALVVPAVVARIETSGLRRPLSQLYAAEGALAAALAFLMGHFWLPAILLLVAVDGIAALTAGALLRTAAAEMGAKAGRSSSTATDDGEAMGARKANASLNMAFTVTFAVGPALGGLTVAAAGGATALGIDAASFLIGSVLLIDQRSAKNEGPAASVKARLEEAWRHLRSVSQLGPLLGGAGAAMVFFSAVEPVEVLYAKASLHAGTRGYGALMGAWGVGTVFGGVVFGRSLRRPLGQLVTGSTLAGGLAYVGLSAAPSLAYACGLAVLGGIGNGIQGASIVSAVQQLTPRELHGRLMAVVQAMAGLCPGLGLLLGGIAAAVASPRTAFLVAGLGAIATSVVFLRVSGGLDGAGRIADQGSGAAVLEATRPQHVAAPRRPSAASRDFS